MTDTKEDEMQVKQWGWKEVLRDPKAWLGLIISGAALWLAFRSVPFTNLVESIIRASPSWLIVALSLQFLSLVTRSKRWQSLLNPSPMVQKVFWSQNIGYLFINILPLRIGEFIRSYTLSSRSELAYVSVLTTAGMERILDVAVVLLGLGLLLPWMELPPAMGASGISLSLLVILGMTSLFLMVRFQQAAERLLQALLDHLTFIPRNRAMELWTDLLSGLDALKGGKGVAIALGWTLISWGLSLAVYWSVLRAFEPNATVIEAGFMLVGLSLSAVVPSSGGYIGVYHLVGQQLLMVPFGLKYSAVQALSITMVAHLVYFLTTSGLGVIGLILFQGFGEDTVVEPAPPSQVDGDQSLPDKPERETS